MRELTPQEIETGGEAMLYRQRTNDRLSQYTDSKGIYAQITEQGKIHLDGYFEAQELLDITDILGGE